MRNADVAAFENSLVKSLVLRFGMNQQDAYKAVKKSAIQQLLKEHSDMVLHYPVEGWSRDIWREYNGLPLDD